MSLTEARSVPAAPLKAQLNNPRVILTLPLGTAGRLVLCVLWTIAMKSGGGKAGGIKTAIFHDSQTSSRVGAMELMRKDRVSVVKVHVH